jgi:predicted nucleic acid-binding protein
VVFIDTGAFLARHLPGDTHHESAVLGWDRLGKRNVRCFTSNFVIDETLTLLARAAGYRFAAERARNLYTSRSLTILRPELEDELAAVQLFTRYADRRVSFTDCVSFVLMKKRRMRTAFSFDRHYEYAGFELLTT